MRRLVEASGREGEVVEKLGLKNGDDGCEMNKLADAEERFSFIGKDSLTSGLTLHRFSNTLNSLKFVYLFRNYEDDHVLGNGFISSAQLLMSG
ncbi:hypothetical protein V6N12_013830 [Hibiscus sabdariffa]|uniref:Uncharacterized protein n=1 Tax=Hibiscus sabdariffa TaxID=183260 RepID=A0ABR2B7E5_9ROSI